MANDTAVDGLMAMLLAVNNNPAPGTGEQRLAEQATAMMGSHIPDVLVNYNTGYQINLFGGYPTNKDIAPCVVFIVVFAIAALAHLFIFSLNYSRGHYFWISIGLVFYCVMRIIGFAIRIAWAGEIQSAALGISSEVFLIVPSIIIVSLNLILAQRLFTWRHPVGGSRRLFWNFMIALYILVAGIVAMTIVAAAIPYIYFLSEASYSRCKKVVETSSILIVLYTLTAVSLIALSYFFKPTTNDENLYTYQPWWIESFRPTYFVRKHAAQDAEETFMKRNHNHRHAIRVIAATHHHYNVVEGLSNQRGNLKHNTSMMIICVSTLFLFIGAVCRAISVFQGRYNKDAGPVCAPVAMYIIWGLFEFLINLSFLVGRIDLRFYRPDILPQKVRSIITAEQSILPSRKQSLQVTPVSSRLVTSDSESTHFNYGFSEVEHKQDAANDAESEFYF